MPGQLDERFRGHAAFLVTLTAQSHTKMASNPWSCGGDWNGGRVMPLCEPDHPLIRSVVGWATGSRNWGHVTCPQGCAGATSTSIVQRRDVIECPGKR